MAVDTMSMRMLLGMLSVLMSCGGALVLAYGVFMTLYIIRPSYRFISPVKAWIGMLIAGTFAVTISNLGVYIACRPTEYRLRLLAKLCLVVMVVKVTCIMIAFKETDEEPIFDRIFDIWKNDTPTWSQIELELGCCGFGDYRSNYDFGQIKISKHSDTANNSVFIYRIPLPSMACYGRDMYNENVTLKKLEKTTEYVVHYNDHQQYTYTLSAEQEKYFNVTPPSGQHVTVHACDEYDLFTDEKAVTIVAGNLYSRSNKPYNDLLFILQTNYTELCKKMSSLDLEVLNAKKNYDLAPKFKNGCMWILKADAASFHDQLLTTLATLVNEITVAVTALVYAMVLRNLEIQSLNEASAFEEAERLRKKWFK